MKRKNLKIAEWVASLLLVVGTIYFLYDRLDFDEIKSKNKEISYGWMGLSATLALAGFCLRAWRWQLTLLPMSPHARKSCCFWALMAGYLVNFIIPRGGELFRCVSLRKTQDIPLPISLGSIINERLIDLLFILLCAVAMWILEFSRFSTFLLQQPWNDYGHYLLWIGLVLTLLFIFLRNYVLKARQDLSRFVQLRKFLRVLWRSVLSLKKIPQPVLYICLTLLLWLLYVAITYTMMRALQDTAQAPFKAVIAVLTMGSLSTIIPAQGNIGTFHGAVILALSWYPPINENSAASVAFWFHASQSVVMLLFGLIGLLLTNRTYKQRTPG